MPAPTAPAPTDDYLVHAVARNENIRALACVTTGLVQAAALQHGTAPTATAALGRVLTGALLMGALLKSGQRVALRFEADGPLRKILAEADSQGHVMGYVPVPDVHLPPRQGKLDVAGALGPNGFLTVTKDLRLKEPYEGVVRLYSGEIADDLAYYLTASEQIPSAVGLGVFVEPDGRVSAAGGFLVQTLPPADANLTDDLVQRIAAMPMVTALLKNGGRPEDMLQQVFANLPLDILYRRALELRCTCSKDRVEAALIALGSKEIENLMATPGAAEVTCQFCRARYVLSREELGRLIAVRH